MTEIKVLKIDELKNAKITVIQCEILTGNVFNGDEFINEQGNKIKIIHGVLGGRRNSHKTLDLVIEPIDFVMDNLPSLFKIITKK